MVPFPGGMTDVHSPDGMTVRVMDGHGLRALSARRDTIATGQSRV